MSNSKLQYPGKSQGRNSQINRALIYLGFGSLEFVWNLDVGNWDLGFAQRASAISRINSHAL
jgi:hypothetical protein